MHSKELQYEMKNVPLCGRKASSMQFRAAVTGPSVSPKHAPQLILGNLNLINIRLDHKASSSKIRQGAENTLHHAIVESLMVWKPTA